MRSIFYVEGIVILVLEVDPYLLIILENIVIRIKEDLARN